jgi:hypothetical protein
LNDRTRTSASAFIDLDKNDHANANIDQGESEAAVILQSSQTLEEAKQGVSVFPHGLHPCEKEAKKTFVRTGGLESRWLLVLLPLVRDAFWCGFMLFGARLGLF